VAGLAAYQAAFFVAVDRIGSTATTMVAGLGALWVAVGRPRAGAPGRAARWGVVGLAVVGAGALLADPGPDAAGVAVAIAAGAAYAAFTAASKRRSPEASPATTLGWAALFLVVPGATGVSTLASWPGLLEVAYLGGIATALAYALFARGLAGTTPPDVLRLLLVQPAVAMVLGALLLGERASSAGALVAGAAAAALWFDAASAPNRSRSARPAAERSQWAGTTNE
jgi:drug/metabolite transporter, DME family